MKYLLIVLAMSFVFLGGNVPVADAAQTCYQMSASTRQQGLTTQNRFGQQYVHNSGADLVSVSVPVFKSYTPGSGGVYFQIQETTAGLPNGNIVAGSEVSKNVDEMAQSVPGIEQAFICDSIPERQVFTFTTPITLTTGTMYAFIIYASIGSNAVAGWVQEFENVAPLLGLDCVGSPCISHVGWDFTTFLGSNFDLTYSVEDAFVDLPTTDGKIDGQIANLREWSTLDDETGGLIFTVIVMLIIFIAGLKMKIPFVIVGSVNALLMGAFTLGDITPPWVLITSIGMVGLAIIAKMAGLGNRGDSSNEV